LDPLAGVSEDDTAAEGSFSTGIGVPTGKIRI
jgi:hypothetical protein